eukprot:scaffold1351_cov176-Amphora_coffeaeformis.AAC.25
MAEKATAEGAANVRQLAAKALLEMSQKDGNVPRYRELLEGNVCKTPTITTLPEGLPPYDANWVQETETAQHQDRAVLRHRLQSVQSHLHKEAIRAAYLALAEHDARIGDVVEAFHSVLRAKDYCTTRQQTATVCLQIVDLSFLLGNAVSAKEYLLRLDHTIGNDTPASVRQDIQTASGLERLMAADYKKAAKHFAEVCKQGLEPSAGSASTDNTNNNSDEATVPGSPVSSTSPRNGSTGAPLPSPTPRVLAPEDISLYAAFLAMGCSMGAEMVALAEHPEALELVPRLKEALVMFGRRCDYRGAWAILEDSVFPVLKYDLFLGPHLEALQTMIREKAIDLYWKAYERVELSVMAAELGPGLVPSAEALQALLVKLIRSGTLHDTRIDLATQTIHRDPAPPRHVQVCAKLDAMTRTTLDDTYSTLTRLSCLEHDLVVMEGSRGGEGRGGRRGGRGRGGPSVSVEDTMMDDREDMMMEMGDGANPEDMY